MPGQKLYDFLKKNKVKFEAIQHPKAYSAREVSHVSHISEKALAKTVICKMGNKLAMFVLPANETVDFNAIKKSLHINSVVLADESEFSKTFGDCEVGAMPPFGNLYDMDVYVEKNLANNKEIAFNAGSHTEVVKLSYQDFEKWVKPKVIEITHH